MKFSLAATAPEIARHGRSKSRAVAAKKCQIFDFFVLAAAARLLCAKTAADMAPDSGAAAAAATAPD